MNTGFYRVAASSPEIYLGDCVNNADNIIHIAESLAKKDVQLVVFPELCITGYSCADMFLRKELLAQAQSKCAADDADYTVARNGDDHGAGLLEVIDLYGSTPSGNLAKHYAGICYLKAGDLENAAEFLARYSPVKGIPGALINAQNYGLQGDVAVERQDYAKAVDFYRTAVKAPDTNLTAPMYPRKAGLAAQAQGDAAAAAGFYQQILDTYPASMEAREAEKLLGSAK